MYHLCVKNWLKMHTRFMIIKLYLTTMFRTHLYPLKCINRGPLTRYVKLRVAHGPECWERIPRLRRRRKLLVSDPDMHHDTCVWIANPWWRGKRSRHSRRMRIPHFFVSGKRPIQSAVAVLIMWDKQFLVYEERFQIPRNISILRNHGYVIIFWWLQK